MSKRVPTTRQNFESRKRALDFNRMATATDTDTNPTESLLGHSPIHLHKEPSIPYTEPPLTPPPPTPHANETGKFPPETMDEAMVDGAKDPVLFQQTGAFADEPEDAVTETWTSRWTAIRTPNQQGIT